MRRRAVQFSAWACLALILPGLPLRADDELELHLNDLQRQVDDPSIPMPRREEIALGMAGTLDRAAQSAPTAEGRRAYWDEAIRRLDRFTERNPDHQQARQFQFQAGVYLWARARSWADRWELAPTDLAARGHSVKDIDAAIARLRAVNETLPGATDTFAQNVRFRLAESLADRAAFEPEGSEGRRRRDEEALRLLTPPPAEPSLQGFAHLLRATLLARTGEPGRALDEAEAASQSLPSPPVGDILESRTEALIRLRRFDEALKAIASAQADESVKGLLTVRVRLAQRASLAPGPERSAAESALFAQVKALRAAAKPEARPALLALARGLTEPDAGQDPDAWDALAEGVLALGDPARAGAIEARGADRAAALGQPERAGALRLRAGAFLFQAEKFVEADAMLSRVADDPAAGPDRPRAGLLRILARARALAARLPGASTGAYVAALESQIRNFPGDPSTGEARWLLGKFRLATNDRKAAIAHWAAIPRDDPRWLDAKLAVAALRQDDLDTRRISNDREPVNQSFREAQAFLSATLGEARSDTERAAVQLASARLELTPDVGHPEEALATSERVQRSVVGADQRDRARRLHLLALAELGRFVEAEREARGEAAQSRPADLFEIVRLIDQVASESESDLRLRRFGLILRTLLNRVLEHPDELSPDERSEARLRQTRALLFSGDQVRARQSLDVWEGTPQALSDRLLSDLADTYARLDAFELAADVQRLRVRRAANGSLPWFAARYGLALAYYRSGKGKDARQLIDATEILHPDLGGGELREKFVRLRQRLNPNE